MFRAIRKRSGSEGQRELCKALSHVVRDLLVKKWLQAQKNYFVVLRDRG
jgi:hypothetical protein